VLAVLLLLVGVVCGVACCQFPASRQLAAGGPEWQVEFELISVLKRRKTIQYFFVSGSSK
jgi:hypothetical protein